MFTFTAQHKEDPNVEIALVCNNSREFQALTKWLEARGYDVKWSN